MIPQFQTATELVTFVRDKLLAQKRQSLTPHNGMCACRGQDGDKCAIGHLIPDCNYSPKMEGHSVRYLVRFFHLPPYFNLANAELLAAIQEIHDDCAPSMWPKEFASLLADIHRYRFEPTR